MDDLGDVGEFEAPNPALLLDQFLKAAGPYTKRNGKINIMNLCYADDEVALQDLIEDGSIGEPQAELLKMAGRLELFWTTMPGESGVEETPVDYPYYVCMKVDNEIMLVFMKDQRLANVIDWSY